MAPTIAARQFIVVADVDMLQVMFQQERLAAAFETVDISSADDVYVFGLESLSGREWTTLRRWKSVPGVFCSLGIADPACKLEILQEFVPFCCAPSLWPRRTMARRST